MRSFPIVAVAVAAGVLVSSVALPGKREPLPYSLAVTVAFGEPLGPERLRLELERELTARLRDAECFERVDPLDDPAAGPSELILELVLDRLEEGTHHQVGIAQHQNPDEQPGGGELWAAQVKADVYLQVRRGADRALVRMKRYRPAITRPAARGEDTHLEAYLDFVADVVRETRSYMCKSSFEKWEKQIEAAKPAAGAD